MIAFNEPKTFAERLALAAEMADANAKESYPNGHPKSSKCPWDVAQVTVREKKTKTDIMDNAMIEYK